MASTPSRRWRRRLLGLAVGSSAFVLVVMVAANIGIRRAAGPYLHAAPSAVPAAPIAIVLGASVHRDGNPSPQLENRLSAALALLRAGRVERILVSGARNGAYDEAGPMRRWLMKRGVPAALVLEDHAGFRTLDTMKRAAHVYSVRRAIVCTQSFHLPRAVFLARRAGIDAFGLAADGQSPDRLTRDAAREFVANLVALVDSYLLDRQPRERG